MLLVGIGLMLGAILLMSKKAQAAVKEMVQIPIQVVEPSTPLDSMIKEAAFKYSVDWKLVKAVAMTESSLNPNASNPKDPSYGLMGIMPILAEDFGIVRDYHNPTDAEIAMIRDPQTNLNIGAWHLHYLTGKYPFDAAVQMYNVGERGYNEGRRNSDYLAKVKSHLGEIS